MEKVQKSNILIVGAGGIGCEILKNVVMWNFRKITVVDLDTIDVSNLNRQFLFRKEHVGKSKAMTAKESVLEFNPDAEIEAICDDIMNPKYNSEFYRKFNVVLNALDNKTARNHVNRQCLDSEVPLVESGTTGYRGQVQTILRGRTACYECYPKPAQKQYPACTIRNTPSEPIHCIVWAKYLFNQLFGEPEEDQDVVPDQNDPELLAAAADSNGQSTSAGEKQTHKTAVRDAWIQNNTPNPELLLRLLFVDAIQSLLSMTVLWVTPGGDEQTSKPREGRTPPVLLTDDCIGSETEQTVSALISPVTGSVRDRELLSLSLWCAVFKYTAMRLVGRTSPDFPLVWDKDDCLAMDFVAAAANIRMILFHITGAPMSVFQIKSLAGNIIPAIATTNAIIAGISVLHAYKIIQHDPLSTVADDLVKKCPDVMVSDMVSARGRIIQAVRPLDPVPDCYVCSQASGQYRLKLRVGSLARLTLGQLRRDVLQTALGMLAPNVAVQHSTTILIDGADDDDDIDEEYLGKSLDAMKLITGSVLRCSDFLQKYEFRVELVETGEENTNWLIDGDVEKLKATARPDDEEDDGQNEKKEEADKKDSRKRKMSTDEENEEGEGVQAKKKKIDNNLIEDDDEDIIMIE